MRSNLPPPPGGLLQSVKKWIQFSYSNEDNEYEEGKGEETWCDR